MSAQRGVRCSASLNLEIDHIQAFALGGESRAENLRVLCAGHNLAVAREVFGRNFVATRIAVCRSEGRSARIAVRRGDGNASELGA